MHCNTEASNYKQQTKDGKIVNEEMRLILERLFKTLERLGERNEQSSLNLDRAERIREADAVRTSRLEEHVTKLTQAVDGLADVVANTQVQIEALAVTEINTNNRIDRLADVVERFITVRGNNGNTGTP